GGLRSTRRRRELTFPAKYGREKWISLLLWLNLATPARARQGEHHERGDRFQMRSDVSLDEKGNF
ncbi:MAG: hypothetical protein IJG88_05525, partial [Eggerthellaceae bacterium]|nr:hypothetical protein [Eggerthellaceae bacterium]